VRVNLGAMAEERPRTGSSIPHGQAEPDWVPPKPARSPTGRPPYELRATMQGLAPAPHLIPAAAPAPAPESEPWIETVVQSVDEFGPGPPLSLPKTRIISLGPLAAPEPEREREPDTEPDPQPPAASPYAVIDNEATLLYHPAAVDLAALRDSAPDSSRMLALHAPMQLAVPVAAVPTVAAVAITPIPARRSDRPPRALVDPRLVLLTDPDSERAASFRLLRDNILSKDGPRVIAVSSGARNEGKTTCAINLALALSERPSARVLLLEGNFLAPSLGKVFQIDASTAPARHMNLPWLMPYRVAEIMPGFDVAALVHAPSEPAPVFNSRWFEMAIGHLSGAGYDFLVIDAAALDGSAPVLQIIGAADGTLLTVRSGGSTARTFRRAAQQIPKGRALGVTLMDGD